MCRLSAASGNQQSETRETRGNLQPVKLKKTTIMTKFKCPCKYTYDPEKGDPKQNIPPGTPFEDLPDTWRCPRCKRKKEKFVPVEE